MEVFDPRDGLFVLLRGCLLEGFYADAAHLPGKGPPPGRVILVRAPRVVVGADERHQQGY